MEKREKQMKLVSVYMTEEEALRLEAAADAEFMTRSGLARKAISRFLESISFTMPVEKPARIEGEVVRHG